MLEKEIPEQLTNMLWYRKKFVLDYQVHHMQLMSIASSQKKVFVFVFFL